MNSACNSRLGTGVVSEGRLVTGPEWLLNGPGERTPGERAMDIKIVARLRHYGVRRDYFHACVALAALTMVVEHLEEGRSPEAAGG